MRSSRSSCPARRAKSRDEECVCACVRVCPKCRAVQRSSADATARRLDFEAVCAYAHDSCACVCCLRAYVACVRRAGGLGSDVWRGARASTVSINQRIASLHLPADARRVGGERERERERKRERERGGERTQGEPHHIVRLLDVVQLPLLAFHLADLELQELDAEGVCTEAAEVTCTPGRRTGAQPRMRSKALRHQPPTTLPSSATTPTPTRRAFRGPRLDTTSRRLTAPYPAP